MRHDHVTDFVAHAMNMNVNLLQNIPQKHPANGRHFETQALFVFLGVGGCLHGAAFASLYFFLETLINHYFFSL